MSPLLSLPVVEPSLAAERFLGEATQWGSRTRALTPAELAERIETIQDRTAGMLFTATATEDLDAIGLWGRAQDQATAGMWRAITTAACRAGGAQRAFVGDEVALSARWSCSRGSSEAEVAAAACELPGLVEAVEDGTFTHWHARMVVRELNLVPALSLEQRAAVVLIVLARYVGQDPGRLGKQVAALIVSIDPVAAAERKTAADGRRQVQCWSEGDGQGVMLLRGPVDKIAAAKAALQATADAPAQAGDERTADQRLFDAAIELVTGGLGGPGAWHVDIVIPYSVGAGGDLELAEIPGFGPILPATARDLAAQADTARRIAVNTHGTVLAVDDTTPGPKRLREQAQPSTELTEAQRDDFLITALKKVAGTPVISRDLSSAGYRVPTRLRRFLQARDKTCTFPGCNRPAQQTDQDHAIGWPAGATAAANIGCLCRHHHRAKQANFRIVRLENGTVRWITRGNQYYDRPPQGF